MLKVKVVVVMNQIPAIQAGLRPKAAQVIRRTTLEIERSSKLSMQEGKTGRLYDRPGGKVHVASAPGEAPAIDYSVLVNSIQSAFPEELTGVVYTNTEYAPALEFGGVRLEPRPFFTPAAERAWPEFLARMKGIVE